MILLEISKRQNGSKKSTLLPLPASQTEMDAALDAIEAKNWSRVKVCCLDCCAPALIPHIVNDDNNAHINRLEQRMQEMNDIQRSKFKVVLEATKTDSVLGATNIAYTLDEYLYLPQYTSPEDVGRDTLEKAVGELVLRYVNLYAYGEALIKSQGSVLTDRGLVSRRDGQPVMTASMSASNEMKLE